ncbi:tRNA methyltransferase, has a role in tRNA modification [Savitreella phatthalungensis]
MTIPSRPADVSRAQTIEDTHVHEVYDAIAKHFSSTRYGTWPVVRQFLEERTAGQIGVDIGCGNGKYLACNPDVFIVGSDRSHALIDICVHERKLECLVCDGLALPHPANRFDFAICIAVVHHYSSPERRVEALRNILALLHKGGEALIYVWALEQKTSRRGWDDGDPQDIMVPWKTQDEEGNDQVFERYYHLYKSGDLERDVLQAGGQIVRTGYDTDNWWAVMSPE